MFAYHIFSKIQYINSDKDLNLVQNIKTDFASTENKQNRI